MPSFVSGTPCGLVETQERSSMIRAHSRNDRGGKASWGILFLETAIRLIRGDSWVSTTNSEFRRSALFPFRGPSLCPGRASLVFVGFPRGGHRGSPFLSTVGAGMTPTEMLINLLWNLKMLVTPTAPECHQLGNYCCSLSLAGVTLEVVTVSAKQ